jgi:hypothetical protein
VTNAILVVPRGSSIRPRITIRPLTLTCLVTLTMTALGAVTTPRLSHGRSAQAMSRAQSFASEEPSAPLRIPAGAQGPVSAALGRGQASYRISDMSIRNPTQKLRAHFTVDGATISAGRENFTLGLVSLGRGTSAPEAAVAPRFSGELVRYDYSDVVESWSNGPLGLEQTFVVSHRPSGAGALTFAMAAPSGARLRAGAVLLPGGLRYGDLHVTDARGRVLRSWLELDRGRLLIKVSDRGARYPLTVDPLVQQIFVHRPADGALTDHFGTSVAVSGHTIVVGSPDHKVGTLSAVGAVYVLTYSSGKWRQTAELTDPKGKYEELLGTAVAISGDTIVASAPAAGTEAQGELLVWSKRGRKWKEAATLTASDAAANDELGEYSIAISAKSIFAGTPRHEVGTVSGQGVVYVFDRSGGGWKTGTQSTEVTEAHGAPDDYVGYSVAISGRTLLAGAPSPYHEDNHSATVIVFTGAGKHWRQLTELRQKGVSVASGDSNLGYSVAISGNTIAAPGQYGAGGVWMFHRSGSNWKQTAALSYQPICQLGAGCSSGGGYGGSVAFSGGTLFATFADEDPAGKQYVVGMAAYRNLAGTWRQVQTTSIGTDPDNGYTSAIASDGDTIAAGLYTPQDVGSLAVFKGTVTSSGPVISGSPTTAGTGLGLPVTCVFAAPCNVTVTANVAGKSTVVAAGKKSVGAEKTENVEMTFNAIGEKLLGKKSGFTLKITVHEYVHGKAAAVASTSIGINEPGSGDTV